MFDDLPEELNQVMLDAPEELRGPNTIHVLAALSVTGHYLRTIFTEATNAQQTLLDYSQNQAGDMSWEYPARICQIADAVLTLRKEPGFDEICRRLKSRDLRSAFFEALAALTLKAHGFAIHARKEAQTLGEDFDFAIEAPGVFANVEATALTGSNFSARSIQNALNRKRRQVPNDKPAIIICFVPGRWRLGVWSIDFELKRIAQAFLRGTRRINYLIFIEDMVLRRGEGGAMLIHALQHRNDTPRHMALELDRLLASDPPQDAATRAILDAGPAPGTVGVGELFRWVEWLFRR